jgi:hypothetical protein
VNAVRHIPAAVRKFPGLAVLVFESERNHVAGGAFHLHAIAQVNSWLDADVRWVQFNPDVHYLEASSGGRLAREVQVPAMKRLDRTNIRGWLEPAESNGVLG